MPEKIRTVSSITVRDFFERHQEALELELIGNKHGFDRPISEPAINRPGLALAGFFSYFAKKRVQVFGNSEQAYLTKMDAETCRQRVQRMCERDIPCLIVARGNEPPQEVLDVCESQEIAIFNTPLVTMNFINTATRCLEKDFASQTSLHGCMVDLRGIGVLVMGASGSGKSETAIGLLERGGALVADDLVIVREVGDELITSSKELARGYLEMRGIGIINVANIYGLNSIRPEKRLDLVVTLKPHSDLNEVDRLGIKRQNKTILNKEIPHVEIPVAPGRDTARLIAVAALDLQLRRIGYDMADEFNQKLMKSMNPTL